MNVYDEYTVTGPLTWLMNQALKLYRNLFNCQILNDLFSTILEVKTMLMKSCHLIILLVLLHFNRLKLSNSLNNVE